MRYGLWTFVAFLPAIPAMAQDAPQIRQFDVAMVEKLGHAMYAQDQAVWHATDALMAQHPAAELQQQKVRGWIVEDVPGGLRVRYVREGEGGLEAAFDIDDPTSARPRVSEPKDRTLTDAEKAQLRARAQVNGHIARPCSQRYNTVALPDPQGDGWLVWALASSTTPKTWFIGGNYRFTVSKDGNTLLRTDALSMGCLTMVEPPPQPDRQIAAQMSTQLVAPIPVETAVFVNLESGLPMFVATPDRTLWEIIGGSVRKSDIKLQAPPAK